MKFNDNELEMFLKDIPFYHSEDSYCLGDTLEEAGAVVRKLCEGNKDKKETKVCGNG